MVVQPTQSVKPGEQNGDVNSATPGILLHPGLVVNGNQHVNIGMGDPYDPHGLLGANAAVNGVRECSRIQKNVSMLSISVMLLLTASRSMPFLQSLIRSSNYYDADYGAWFMAGGQLFSILFLPTIFIRQLTVKKVLMGSMVGHVVYMATQIYPNWILLVITGFVKGICMATLMTSVCTYVAQIAQQFVKFRTDAKLELMLVRFFGIFVMLYNSATLWSNFLRKTNNRNNYYDGHYDYDNETGEWWWEDDYYGHSQSVTYAKAGIFVGVGVVAILLTAFFVDHLKRYGEKAGDNGRSSVYSIFGTFCVLKNPSQLLLIPALLWVGAQQGLYSRGWGNFSIYNEDYNTNYPSYSSVIFYHALASVIGSFGSSIVARGHFGISRYFTMGLASCLNLIVLVTLLSSKNYVGNTLLYTLASLWGISNGIWQSELYAYLALLSKKDLAAAFTAYQLWGFVGGIITSIFFESTLLYEVLIGVLLLGVLSYVIVEVKEKGKNSDEP